MAKKSIEVEAHAYYDFVVNCPECLLDNEFNMSADKKKLDVECEHCGEIFEVKIKK